MIVSGCERLVEEVCGTCLQSFSLLSMRTNDLGACKKPSKGEQRGHRVMRLGKLLDQCPINLNIVCNIGHFISSRPKALSMTT